MTAESYSEYGLVLRFIPWALIFLSSEVLSVDWGKQYIWCDYLSVWQRVWWDATEICVVSCMVLRLAILRTCMIAPSHIHISFTFLLEGIILTSKFYLVFYGNEFSSITTVVRSSQLWKVNKELTVRRSKSSVFGCYFGITTSERIGDPLEKVFV